MTNLRLVLRGMWFRRGVSVAVLVIASLVVGGAVTGPLFLRAAGESVVRDTLNQALPIGRTMNDHVSSDLAAQPLAAAREISADRIAQAPTLDRLLTPPVASLQLQAVVGAPGSGGDPAPLVYRQGVCAHVHLVRGRCPDQRGTVMISTNAAASQRWRVGDPLVVDGRRLHVVGVYAPLNPKADYWGGHPYFPYLAALSGASIAGNLSSGLDAVFAALPTVRAQPQHLEATGALDRTLDVDALRIPDLPVLKKELLAYAESPSGSVDVAGYTNDSAILAVLLQAEHIKDRLTVPVWVVEAQLLLLCWLVLFLVVANAAEARGQEVALAKLRGVPALSTVAFGLLDTLLLVALSVPIGLGLAIGWVSALTDLQLAPGTPVVVTTTTLWAAVGAGAGAAVAAALAASRTLRRPVVEQWRRATRQAKARPWAVDALVVAASLAGLVLLARNGAVGSGADSVLALVAPGLVVLAAALLGSRLVLGFCRAGYEPTRRRGSIGSFLAVRQLGRRPSTLRLTLVLAVAFGLVTFAIDAWSVARTNQLDRAYTEVGAARVLSVTAPPGEDLAAIVDRLDPSGRQAAAVTMATDYSGPTPVQVLAVQPNRFARVAFWRQDFGRAPLKRLVKELTSRTAPPVSLSGDAISLSVDVDRLSAAGAPVLVADLAQPDAGLTSVDLGTIRGGAQVLRATLPCDARACLLAGLHLDRPSARFFPIRARLSVTGVRVHRAGDWHELAADLARPDGWRPDGGGATAARPGPTGLTLTADAGDAALPTWQVADRPVALPALVTSPVVSARTHVEGLDGADLPLRATSVGPALPGAGAHGAVVDRAYALRAAAGASSVATDTVWLAPSAVSTFPDRLEQAGVIVLSTRSAADLARLYSRQGPALALLLFLAGAALGALLAAGGAVLNLHLTGRRRTYEVAAMTALGVRRRSLLASLYVEQALLLVLGIAVGVVAGLVGAVLAVPSVPEFADPPDAPPPLYGLHLLPVLGVVAASAVVLVVVVAVSSGNLLRTARVEQLREAPA